MTLVKKPSLVGVNGLNVVGPASLGVLHLDLTIPPQPAGVVLQLDDAFLFVTLAYKCFICFGHRLIFATLAVRLVDQHPQKQF